MFIDNGGADRPSQSAFSVPSHTRSPSGEGILRAVLQTLVASAPSVEDSEYLRGRVAADRYARICALDEIALLASASHPDRGPGGQACKREITHTAVALQKMARRLEATDVTGDGEAAVGYRDGIRRAHNLVLAQLSSLTSRGPDW